jgi:hypothetical protein
MHTHGRFLTASTRLLLGVLVLLYAALAGAQGAGGARADADRLTLDLADAIRSYHQARPAERSARLSALADIARQRRDLLLQLLDASPAEVHRLALPAALSAGLPAELSDLIEQRVQVEGELTVLYEDPETGAGRLRHMLVTPAGERLELRFSRSPRELMTGTRVQARGLRLGHPAGSGDGDASLLIGGTQDLNVLALDGTGTTAAAAGPAVLTDTRGAQNVLVLLVNFASQPDNQPWTLDDAQTQVFTYVDTFMRENSGGLTWMTGAAQGWLTIDYDPTTCQIDSDFTPKADQAAAAAGIDVSAYRRILYLFPLVTACSWAGQGTVGGNPSRAWSNGRLSTLVVGHELGHNFGLWHAHALECGTAVLGEVGDTCTNIEYGDRFEIMGNNGPYHFDAFHKAQLGWLGQPDTPQIQEVTASGSYRIAPYISDTGGGPVALKVPRGADPATGAPRWYYLEFREPVGYDSPIASNANVSNGVLFRSAADSDGDSSFALDMTPSSYTGTSSYIDWDDPALVAGASYTDAAAGVSFTTVAAAGSSGAAVDIGFAAPACVRAAPALTLAPADGQWAAPGTAVQYSLQIDSRDSASCANASFALNAVAPLGWPAAVLPGTLSLAPGSSATVALQVTSPASAGEGVYDIPIQVAESADPTLAATGAATYVVQAPVVPPVAVNDSASTTQKTPVVIPVLANDWDPQSLPLTLVSVTPPAQGLVQINADGTLTYTPNARFKGSDSFSYQISNGVASAGATVSVQVLAAPRGGGGNGGGKPPK